MQRRRTLLPATTRASIAVAVGSASKSPTAVLAAIGRLEHGAFELSDGSVLASSDDEKENEPPSSPKQLPSVPSPISVVTTAEMSRWELAGEKSPPSPPRRATDLSMGSPSQR